MKTPHILLLRTNVHELRNHLEYVIGVAPIAAIEAEIKKNVIQMFELGVEHYNFAKAQSSTKWRQIVSRSYYGAYNVSKSVRFAVSGEYSTAVSDHSKTGQLPPGFPNLSTYTNQLKRLREDRNLCDYDHSAVESELVFRPQDYLQLVDALIADTRTFLQHAKGITV